MQPHTVSAHIGENTISVTHSDLAAHAHGAALCRSRDTLVLATAVIDNEPQPQLDFVPLTVDFEERYYAAGEILGSRYHRREGKPSEAATLAARAVDRTVRPLFPQDLRRRVHVVVTVLALGDTDPDVLAINAASAALAQAPIPWRGPVGAVRITRDAAGTWAVNPPGIFGRLEEPTLSCIVAGTGNRLTMIEGGAREVSEETVREGLERAQAPLAESTALIARYAKDTGSTAQTPASYAVPEQLEQLFGHMKEYIAETLATDSEGFDTNVLEDRWYALVGEEAPEQRGAAGPALKTLLRRSVAEQVLVQGQRPDGRAPDVVRPLRTRAGGVSPAVHGSSIFYRGETHVVSVLTLGALDDRKLIGTMENPDAAKRFIHHYNFPPYSVGETGKITGPGRREIGHGALAERALRPLIPERDAFPHTIRLVAEVMSSNGSTSMASVCAGSVALMDGGVPLPRHVAGVAIGLVRESEENYRLLTDIQGPEDAFGDMDCKVAGTREGITALQLDVADTSVRSTIIGEALEAARSARHQILDEMEAAIETPRAALNPNAPTTDTMSIPRDTIGAVIGSGGNTIRDIIDESGVDDISIQDDGKTLITGKQAAVEQAKERVRDIIASSQ